MAKKSPIDEFVSWVVWLGIFVFVGYTIWLFSPSDERGAPRAGIYGPPVEIAAHLQHVDQEWLRAVLDEFTAHCQPLFGDYVTDLEAVRVTSVADLEDWSYWRETYKWDREVVIEVSISPTPSSIPRSIHAAGHTEHIHIGGPTNPGFTVAKFPNLCGGPVSKGEDVLIGVQSLASFF